MYHTRITKIDLAGYAAEVLSYVHYVKIREWIDGYMLRGNVKDAITETKEARVSA